MKLVRETIESIAVERPTPRPEQPQGMCLDKGYDFQEVRDILAEFGFTAHIRARGEEAQQLKRDASQRARRWVVERTFGWLGRYRRLARDYEHTVESSEAMTYLASVRRMLRLATK